MRRIGMHSQADGDPFRKGRLSQIYELSADILRAVYDQRISAPSVLDARTHFPGAAAFIRDWKDIREEALAIAARLQSVPRFHELMPEQSSISANDGRDWRMFIMKAYGVEQPENLSACPKLAAIVRAEPQVLSASFSFLGPHKRIPSHRGPLRGVLRFFLMLSMPMTAHGKPSAVLKVGGVEHRLRDGESLLWDDTYPHEAWNTSDTVRIVLSLDVRRAGMPLDMRLLSEALFSVVRLGMKLRRFSASDCQIR